MSVLDRLVLSCRRWRSSLALGINATVMRSTTDGVRATPGSKPLSALVVMACAPPLGRKPGGCVSRSIDSSSLLPGHCCAVARRRFRCESSAVLLWIRPPQFTYKRHVLYASQTPRARAYQLKSCEKL